jgi:phospholipid/cholesterol/gamma-HCH transport system substrate-binding protein
MSGYRRSLIGLCVFVTVCAVLIWTVFVTLQRDVHRPTNAYSALFTDVSGLKVGDEVRMAGVRVGRVDAVELDGTHARVDFRVDAEQVLYGNTVASIVYQNIIGQRYLGLSLGELGERRVLPAGSLIGLERTQPSFDISHLLNGFEPLFALLDPDQVDALTTAVVQAMQGDSGAITTLIAETTRLTESFAGTDAILDSLLNNLNPVLRSLEERSGELDASILSARAVFDGFARRRAEFIDSVEQVSVVGDRLATVIGDVQPDLGQWLQRQPGFAKHFVENKQGFAYMAFNTPLMLKGLARFSQNGSYLDIYACDLTVSQFPRIDALMRDIVEAATPAGVPQRSSKCR